MSGKTVIFVFVIASLWGCTSGNRTASEPPARDVSHINDAELCKMYGVIRFYGEDNPKLRAEVERRGLFSAAEWDAIENKQVFVGMKEDAVMVSLGTPDHKSSLTTANGIRKTLFYDGRGIGESRARIYLDNGKVTAIGQ